MALQSSGAISLSDIASEFGDSAPHSINEFYRGGSLVSNTSTNTNVPTSGQVSFNDFYGAAGALWSTTVTNGYTNFAFDIVTAHYRGFKSGTSGDSFWSQIGNLGSANDSTVDFLGGASLIVLGESTLDVEGDSDTGELCFEVQGTFTNSAFTTLTTGGVSYSRASATYSSTNGRTKWTWNTPGQSPFGTSLSQQTNTSVVFA